MPNEHRDAQAGELEQNDRREPEAGQREPQRRIAAEKRSRSLWTKIALTASCIALILGCLGWLWISQGGGSLIREKQILRELTRQAEEGDPLLVLNRARAFLDDPVNASRDYTLPTTFSDDLRQILRQAIHDLKTDHAADLLSYAAMSERVDEDAELEPPQHFLERIDKRLALPEAGNLAQHLQTLERRLNIDQEPDPFLKVAHINRFLEAHPVSQIDRDSFAQAFRTALDHLFDLLQSGKLQTDHLHPLQNLHLRQAPRPGPLLQAAVDALTLGTLSPDGLSDEEITAAVTALDQLLEQENALHSTDISLPDQSAHYRSIIFALLNHVSGSLRDGYHALQPEDLDHAARARLEQSIAPLIDRRLDTLIRLAVTNREHLIEFLSLVAEVNSHRALLETLIEPSPYAIPSALLRALDLNAIPQDHESLEKVAHRLTNVPLEEIPHGRPPETWEAFVAFLRARAAFILLQLQFGDLQTGIQGHTLSPETIQQSLAAIEDNLSKALELHSGFTGSLLRLTDTYQKVIQALGEETAIERPFHPDIAQAIGSLAQSAFASLPQERQNILESELQPEEKNQLAWMLEPTAPLQDAAQQAWKHYHHRLEGAAAAISYRLPPFHELSASVRESLLQTFTPSSRSDAGAQPATPPTTPPPPALQESP